MNTHPQNKFTTVCTEIEEDCFTTDLKIIDTVMPNEGDNSGSSDASQSCHDVPLSAQQPERIN